MTFDWSPTHEHMPELLAHCSPHFDHETGARFEMFNAEVLREIEAQRDPSAWPTAALRAFANARDELRWLYEPLHSLVAPLHAACVAELVARAKPENVGRVALTGA